jgi:hypothetical protein
MMIFMRTTAIVVGVYVILHLKNQYVKNVGQENKLLFLL